MKNKMIIIVAFLIFAMFGSTVAAEAHGSRVYFSFGVGVGTPYYGPPVAAYYPGGYPVYQPYVVQGYYAPYYPPPVIYRTYVPYGPRVYRGYAPYYGHHYSRGHAYPASRPHAHAH